MNKLTLHLIKGLTGIDIEELENHIDALETKNQQLSFLIKDANKETSYRRTQLLESQKQLSQSGEKINERDTVIGAQSKEITILQKDLAGLLKTVSTLQAEQQEQLQLRIRQEEEIQNQKELTDRLSEQLLTARQQEQEAREACQALTAKARQWQEECNLLKTEKEAQAQQIEALTHTVSEHSQLKQELQVTAQETEGHKATIHAQLQENQDLQKEIERLQARLAEAENLQKQVQEEAQKWQQQCTAAQQDLNRTAEEKAGLKQQLDNLLTEYQQLKAEKAEAEKVLADTQSKEEESRAQEMAQLKDSLRSQQQENQGLQKEIEQLKVFLIHAEDQHKQEAAQLHARLSQAESERKQMRAETQAWQQKCTDAQQSLNCVAEEKANLEQTLADLQSELQQLKVQKEEAEKALANIRSKEEVSLSKEDVNRSKEEDTPSQEEESLNQAETLHNEEETRSEEEAVPAAELLPTSSTAEAQEEAKVLPEAETASVEETTPAQEIVPEAESLPAEETVPAEETAVHCEENAGTAVTTASPSTPEAESTSTPSAPEASPAEPSQPEAPASQESDHLLKDYQTLKAELEKSTLHYPYTRITTAPDGCQYIYESKNLRVKTELFTWGIEGKEVILDEPHFIAYDEIRRIEGLETPYLTESMTCDFSDEGNGSEIAETLLMAICCYHPLHITYRDKNGRISERNLYWVCFQPQGKSKVELPYNGLFNDMLEGEIDSEHILAMHAHHPEARVFTINQIQSIQVFDAFVTTHRGIETQIDALYSSVLAAQPEAADMIYQCLPEQFKKQPQVISRRAHYKVLTGDYEKAMGLYLSIAPTTGIDTHFSWQQFNGEAFDAFIQKGVESENFEQLKEALREEGWEI